MPAPEVLVSLLASLLLACAPGTDGPLAGAAGAPGWNDRPDTGGPDLEGSDSGGADSGGADSGGADSGGADSGGEDSGGTDSGSGTSPTLLAGFRASPYGQHDLGDARYWEEVATAMAARFDDATPAGLWIVGVAGDDGTCYLSFPSPGGTFDDVAFTGTDLNEAALDRFDAAGIRVWLQVEPADADVGELVDLVLDRYGHHPSVVGFGVDVEWFRFRSYDGGKPVSDAKARDWRDGVRAHDAGYTLFLKHWLTDRMPPTEREGLLFVDDGQGVGSLDELVATFTGWGEAFAPAPVAFQYGYESDRRWWSTLADPPTDIGEALRAAVPATAGLYWVDFTVEEVFPP